MFLKALSNISNLPSETLFVTLDVKSLYTNIPHSEGIEACQALLNNRQVLQPPAEDLVYLIDLILTRSNFTFENKHYLQTHRTAMGTWTGPSYASIIMGSLERRILGVNNRPNIRWRYIDDMFVIWPFGKGCLINFINQINNMHPTIKLTAEWSNTSVSFLDIRVILDQGRITTALYITPMDTHQYLHKQSCHPGHCYSSGQ